MSDSSLHSWLRVVSRKGISFLGRYYPVDFPLGSVVRVVCLPCGDSLCVTLVYE